MRWLRSPASIVACRKNFSASKTEIIFFDCSKLIEVYSHPLICPLLRLKLSAKKIYYCGKILKETDSADFIDLFNCTD